VPERREVEYYLDVAENIKNSLGTNEFNGTACIGAPLDFSIIDKYKEAGYVAASITASLTNYLTATGGGDKNPWNTTGAVSAFNVTINDIGQTVSVTLYTAQAMYYRESNVQAYAPTTPGST